MLLWGDMAVGDGAANNCEERAYDWAARDGVRAAPASALAATEVGEANGEGKGDIVWRAAAAVTEGGVGGGAYVCGCRKEVRCCWLVRRRWSKTAGDKGW